MSAPAIATDLYELTMMAGYWSAGMMPRASFELYVRQLPPHRSFLVTAGLEQALAYLEALRFSADEIAYLRSVPALRGVGAGFFDDFLPAFRFTGDVWAADEGTVLFPPAPLLRITAPLPEAQLVETALLAYIGFQTSVASRAARMVHAAAGRDVVEFGARRAHGIEAGVLAARAAFLAGCASTSNVEAGRQFGIPVAGTMAHSWVTAFARELDAFREYEAVFRGHAVLLLDTYDTVAAAKLVVASGLHPQAVRLDSGDLAGLSREVRGILDAGGLRGTRIFVSGDLDEWGIRRIVEAGAPVDGFGVGAALSTSSDVPSLGAIYKLVEIDRGGAAVPVMKESAGKRTYPGRKQAWRRLQAGAAVEDVLDLESAAPPADGRPLLRRVMHNGMREHPPQPLADLRAAHSRAVAELPGSLRALETPAPYPVRIGADLQAATNRRRT